MVEELALSQRQWIGDLVQQLDEKFYSLSLNVQKCKKAAEDNLEAELIEVTG